MISNKKSVVIVTGGSSGIEEVLVHMLLKREFSVIIVDKKEGNSPHLAHHYGEERC